MRVDLFDFDLPPELVAQRPVRPRDAARLLLVGDAPVREATDARPAGAAAARRPPGPQRHPRPADPLLRPARRGAGRGHPGRAGRRPAAGGRWPGPASGCGRATAVELAPGLAAEVAEKDGEGRVRLALRARRRGAAGRDPRARRHAAAALYPPARAAATRATALDYQTGVRPPRRCGRRTDGLAPLHRPSCWPAWTPRGVERCFVTLHVGAGTFAPVKVEDTERARDARRTLARCPRRRAAAIAAARAARRPRRRRRHDRAARPGIAVGRATASCAPGAGETRLFVTPGYRFRVVDRLLTNFHLPRSTLFMLVAAFAGLERIQAAYAHASPSASASSATATPA